MLPKAFIRLKPSMNFTNAFAIRRLDFNRQCFCNSAILSRSDIATFAEQNPVTANELGRRSAAFTASLCPKLICFGHSGRKTTVLPVN